MSTSVESPSISVPFVDLTAHHAPLQAEMNQAIQGVLESCAFIRGERAAEFERNFADFLGAGFCVGVGNGTDALYIALRSLGVSSGDEVITVANSFIATSEAITQTGARVVFVDCDATYTIDPSLVERAITPKTKAIIPVHLYGQPADMAAILAIAEKHGLYVIEDAAQAHGALFEGRPVGTLGDFGCFSFYPGKNLGAIGDAGAIVTNDEQLATRARMYANHGRVGKYDHEFEGVNSRLDGIQAAVLNVKLRQLRAWNERRREVARRYDEALQGCCATPSVRSGVEHVYHLYVIRVAQRDHLRQTLGERGISTGVHYPIPLPLLQAYRYLNHTAADFPVASALAGEILSLPIHGAMPDSHVEHVVSQLTDILQNVDVRSYDGPKLESTVRSDRLRRDCA